MAPAPPSSSALSSAKKSSTLQWRSDLKTLFEHAKERFSDVVWELYVDERRSPEEVWGHKAIVYARAPPSFQARYFSARPMALTSPSPYGASPMPHAQSSYSLSLPPLDFSVDTHGSRSPSPFNNPRAPSPAPSTNVTAPILRIPTDIAPALFSNELEYLYTGSGLSDAFEFFYDDAEKRAEGDEEENRVDKLRKDLVFMWRSRLYSDIRISLTGDFSSSSSDRDTAALFSSHRFILVSRSSYFRTLLLSRNFAPVPHSTAGTSMTITLPHPPFTPASLHFTLGYIYTGTLAFSHRTFDLTTAFHIFRSAMYLSLNALVSEIEAVIVEDMMHGLFHAYLPFEQYEKITAGRWGVGGCKCKTCQRRAPRVLEFAMADDVQNSVLTRGAQRALVGMYGEGWCSSDFANLPHKTRHNLLKGVQLRTTPTNVIPLLFATHSALSKLEILEAKGDVTDAWIDTVRDMIHVERKRIDEVMCVSCEEVFEQEEWVQMLERDGAEFGDAERVEWVMDSVKRGITDQTAGIVYQTLVSAILIRAHPSAGIASTILPTNSVIRAHVERARLDLIQWIGRQNRWQLVHHARGFEVMEPWAVKEISDEIDVPVDLLLARQNPAQKDNSRNWSKQASNDEEGASISSLHASVMTRSRPPVQNSQKDQGSSPTVHASSASIRSAVTNTSRYKSPTGVSRNPSAAPKAATPPPAMSSTGRAIPAARLQPILSSREPSMAIAVQSDDTPDMHDPNRSAGPSSGLPLNTNSPQSAAPAGKISPRHLPTSSASSTARPPSITPSLSSLASERSKASTVRKTSGGLGGRRSLAPEATTRTQQSPSSKAHAGNGSHRSPGEGLNASNRPTSTLSMRSDVSTVLKPTKSDGLNKRGQTSPSTMMLSVPPDPSTPGRRNSQGSSRSPAGHASTPVGSARLRRASAASTTSTVSVAASTKGGVARRPSGGKTVDDAINPAPSAATDSNKSSSRRSVAGKDRKSHSRRSVDKTTARSSMASDLKVKPDRRSKANQTTDGIRNSVSSLSMRSSRSSASDEDKQITPSVAAAAAAALIGRSKALDVSANAQSSSSASHTPRAQPKPVPISSDGLGLQLGSKEQRSGEHSSEDDNGEEALAHRDARLRAFVGAGKADNRRRTSRPPTKAAGGKSDSTSTIKGVIDLAEDDLHRRRDSNDTITGITHRPTKRVAPSDPPPDAPGGITLHVGIPCIISSKRAKFKAFARYIGEVEGETGPWVGVEVPLGESTRPDKIKGRNWNDGSVAGVRYFELGTASALDWDTGEQRAARRRRIDILLSDKGGTGTGTLGNRKREGDQLSFERKRLKRSASPAISEISTTAEIRGLFVRPQQVLYVVDAEQ